MRTHIDWLTFTLVPRYNTARQADMTIADAYADAIEYAFLDTFGKELTAEVFGGSWEKNERSRAPYTDAWKMASGDITLFASPSLMHCCVEISGKGCEALISKAFLDKVLQQVYSSVTRIDIACDIETSTRPEEFTAIKSHERMRASGYQKSETGETCYVGSQKSDRYARVYRYNHPHPRAHLLRVEHVFRKDYAKVVAEKLLRDGIEAAASASGLAFGWAHKEWDPAISDSGKISIVGPRREDGNTIHWLINSCAPAFKRLCETGGITDPQAFLETYFMG